MHNDNNDLAERLLGSAGTRPGGKDLPVDMTFLATPLAEGALSHAFCTGCGLQYVNLDRESTIPLCVAAGITQPEEGLRFQCTTCPACSPDGFTEVKEVKIK